MKSAAYIDAYICACPSASQGEDSLVQFVQNLVNWVEIRQSGWLNTYISTEAVNALYDSGKYPPFQTLTAAMRALSVEFVQAKDVFDLVNSLLTKSRMIEDELSVTELRYSNVMLVPVLDTSSREPPFDAHLLATAVLISLHRFVFSDFTNQILIAAPDLKYEGTVTIRADVNDWLSEASSPLPETLAKPICLSSTFEICKTIARLYLSLDAVSVCANGTSQTSIEKAIIAATHQATPDLPSLPPFRLGPLFADSCRRLGFFESRAKTAVLLRACAETVLGTAFRDCHPLRTSSGGNAPQIKRDNMSAWRRDIDYEYHLHYWSSDAGPFFVKVVRHEDMSIE